MVHDIGAHGGGGGDAYSDGGFIAPLDQYQGEIRLGTFSGGSEPGTAAAARGVKKTYVERRETTEYLN